MFKTVFENHLDENNWCKITDFISGDFPKPRFGHTANKYGEDSIILFGGQGPDPNNDDPQETLFHSFDDAFLFDTKTFTWFVIGNEDKDNSDMPRPPPRNSHAAVITGSDLYIFGGANHDGPMNDMWKLNIATQSWTEVKYSGSQSPRPIEMHSMCVYNSKFFVTGGRISTNLSSSGVSSISDVCDDIWIFDLCDKVWTKLHQKISTSRCCHVSFFIDSHYLVTFAGCSKTSTNEDLMVYDVKKDCLEQIELVSEKERSITPLHLARLGHACTNGNNKDVFFIFGGVNSTSDLNDILCLTLNKVRY